MVGLLKLDPPYLPPTGVYSTHRVNYPSDRNRGYVVRRCSRIAFPRFSILAMSMGQSKSRRREAALQAARRRVQRLEFETHRIKAELARLEAANENDLADELAHELRGRGPLATGHEAHEQRVHQ